MIAIEQAGPGVTVQDGGRPGHMHDGIPPGGALVPELLWASNRALGNADDAAAIEIPSSLTIRAVADTIVAVNGVPRVLAAGERLSVERMSYLAMTGGIDVPIRLGGRGTLPVAALGGFEGRALRAGDVLRAQGGRPIRTRLVQPASVDPEAPIRVIPGPDPFPDAALDTLFTAELRIGPSDRVGTRLTGVRLPVEGADAVGSLPLVRGAIQVTRDGTPIVLGPDHPTTGGYRVIAVVCTADLGPFAHRPFGAPVRFIQA